MRIVHAVRSDGFAGVERHVARLARAQARGGDRVVVIGGAPEPMRAAVGASGVRLHPATTTADVVHALRTAAPGADIVHTHMTAAEVAVTAAGVTGPVVTTRHFASLRGSGRLGPLTAAVARRRVDAQIAISHYVAAHVDGASTVVYPGVEPRPDGRTADDRDRTVLMVQRLEPEKGTDIGVRSFAASGLANAGWRLDIAGDGSRRAALTALAADLGVTDSVRFLGVRVDVEDLMDRAGLLLAPCPVEGLGLSVLEAMASGLPVVASDAGGHRETIGAVSPSALFPVSDHEEGGSVLALLAADPAARDVAARGAATAQRSVFTPRAQVKATADVYAEVF